MQMFIKTSGSCLATFIVGHSTQERTNRV
jgi:hypothetical protein